MAGILDQKSRVLDSIITEEGRRQISQGQLKAVFYSFSDIGAFYKLTDQFDSGSINQNNSFRFSIESTNEPKDSITFESDDSGRLKVKEFISIGSSSVKIHNGMIISGSVAGNTRIISGTDDDFAPLITGILSKSIDNFKNQYIIGSPDLLDNRFNEFLISNKNIQFVVSEDAPILSQRNGGTQDANINNIESLFADKRLSHVPNYKYLPPVNKPRLGSAVTLPLGLYPHFGQEPITNYEDLKKEFKSIEDAGYCAEISFTETSKANRTVSQFFEISEGILSKLDCLDFGIFTVNNEQISENDLEQIENQQTTKHVYFVGKLFKDSNGSTTFVNIFSLVFSWNSHTKPFTLSVLWREV